jgi:hypothetical protein
MALRRVGLAGSGFILIALIQFRAGAPRLTTWHDRSAPSPNRNYSLIGRCPCMANEKWSFRSEKPRRR